MGRRRTVLLLAFMGSTALLAPGVLAGFGPTGPPAQVRERPNILPVATDDLDDGAGSIAYVGGPALARRRPGRHLQQRLRHPGPVLPVRGLELRGRYPHNAGVDENNGADQEEFVSSGKEAGAFATRVRGAGHRTAYFGKYLNGYDTERMPAGWDRWFSDMGRSKLQNFDDQGEEVYFDPQKHHFEDVLRDEALEWLGGRDDAPEPFLAVLSTHAPHPPATPARRHANLFPGADLPRPESFDEKQVDDKNGWTG